MASFQAMASTRPPRNPELEGIVIEALRTTEVGSPARREAWAVYADWLLSRGEPVGEWLAASLHFDAGDGVAAPVRARLGDIERATRFRLVDLELADLSEVPELERIAEFTWERGFITNAVFRGPEFRAWDSELLGHTPDRFLAVVLASPSAYMLHELELELPMFRATGARYASFAELLADLDEPLALRRLVVLGGMVMEFHGTELAAMPELIDFRWLGSAYIDEPLSSASLRSLELHSATKAGDFPSLGSSDLPALERLVLRSGPREPTRHRRQQFHVPQLSKTFAPRLRELELDVEGDYDMILEQLANTAQFAQLERVVLVGVSERGAQTILDKMADLGATGKLELRTVRVSSAIREALVERGFRVVRLDAPL